MNIITLGKQIYDMKNPREVHRWIVFVGRSILHYSVIRRLYRFFQKNEVRQQIFAINKFPIEQVTRAFFYKGSTFSEREKLIRAHFEFLQSKLQAPSMVRLNTWKWQEIWKASEEDIDWQTSIGFAPGQRKEGLMSLIMHLDGAELYQMMFWFAKDKNGEDSLWIGAMQGPNMANAKDIIKDITKRSFRYRTKNLILYMTQAVARSFEVKHIYAVSNEGYYANNHVRRDRKLKTDFGAFWEETGGHITTDSRFYEIPLVEPRKSMEDVPTRKRAVYRKRFAFQDDVDAQITKHMNDILLKSMKE